MAEQLKRQPYAQPTLAKGSRASWKCCYEPITVVELLAMLGRKQFVPPLAFKFA